MVATWRRRGPQTKAFGPYYRLRYREDGRQRSVYLGRAEEKGTGPICAKHRAPTKGRSGRSGKLDLSPSLVEQVRRMLADLQQPRRQRRAINRLRRQVCAALRAQKGRLDTQLRRFGLRLQGFEVRGWRTSTLRGLTAAKHPSIRRLRPIRRPQFKASWTKPFKRPKLPRYNSRRLSPAAIEERLWQAIAVREGSLSEFSRNTGASKKRDSRFCCFKCVG